MTNQPNFKKIRSDSELQTRINRKVNQYFKQKNMSRYANFYLAIKGFGLVGIFIWCFYILIQSTSLYQYFGYSFLILFVNLVLAMTIGHDAAHGSVTNNKYLDFIIYSLIFMLNGINPGLWRHRHNDSHHRYPNVHDLDTDIAITRLIYLSPSQEKYRIHRYQHVYAPFLYIFFSLSWLFFIDIKQIFEYPHSSFLIKFSSLLQILIIKVIYCLCLVALPVMVAGLPLIPVILIFLLSHFILSLFLSFTFFMSHHVNETHYFELDGPGSIETSWLRNQIQSTVDFHGESVLANFIFGGFHAHIAHHLFPSVSHIHYPRLTSIIREELTGSEIRYQSINFMNGIFSHLRLLKRMGATVS